MILSKPERIQITDSETLENKSSLEIDEKKLLSTMISTTYQTPTLLCCQGNTAIGTDFFSKKNRSLFLLRCGPDNRGAGNRKAVRVEGKGKFGRRKFFRGISKLDLFSGVSKSGICIL